MNTSLARRAAAVAIFLFTAACVSKPNAGSQIFGIDPPPLRAPPPAPGARVVSVDRVEVAPQVAGRAVTYRVGPHSFERDPWAVLAAPPRDLVLAVLRGALANAEFVREVVELGGPVTPEVLVEAYVSDLEGDFTVSDKPVAVVGVELIVLAVPPPPSPIQSVLRKAYQRRLPVKERTAAAVADAWNQGLTSIVEEFIGDMRTALPPPTPVREPAAAPAKAPASSGRPR